MGFAARLIGCYFLLSTGFVMANDAGVPIFRVDTDDKTSWAVGQELGAAFKQHFPDIERRYDAYLSTAVAQSVFNERLRQQVQPIKSRTDPDYLREVEGIASRWQIASQDELGDGFLSLNEYWYLLLMPDIGHRTKGSGFGVWGKASQSGRPIVGHNVDWYTDPNLRSLQAMTVYNGRQGRVVNIGFAGYVGVISGFNQDGLYLAYLDSPLWQVGHRDSTDGHSIVFAMRKALQAQTSVAAASRYLTRYPYLSSHSILMADYKVVKVLEQPQGQLAHLRGDKSQYRLENDWNRPNQIAVVNCFVLAGSPANCVHSQDIFRWERFKTLAQFGPGHQADAKDIIQIMLDPLSFRQAIFNANTLQSMVFTPGDGKLRLYAMPTSGPLPDEPGMREFNGLLPQDDSAEGQWLTMFNVILLISFLVLVAVFVYGEKARKKKRAAKKTMLDYLRNGG